MKQFEPCMCSSCSTPEQRQAVEDMREYERKANRLAFALFLADRNEGRPVRASSYYRDLAEQEMSAMMEVATA